MILYSKLPVLWELMSDQHQAPRTEIQEDSCSYKKKNCIFFFLCVCLFVVERMVSSVTLSRVKRSAPRPHALSSMSSATVYSDSVLQILHSFLQVACFVLSICIEKRYLIRAASLLQLDSGTAVQADAPWGNAQHVACS